MNIEIDLENRNNNNLCKKNSFSELLLNKKGDTNINIDFKGKKKFGLKDPFQKIIYLAFELKLNMGITMTIIENLNLNQNENELITQFLDQYNSYLTKMNEQKMDFSITMKFYAALASNFSLIALNRSQSELHSLDNNHNDKRHYSQIEYKDYISLDIKEEQEKNILTEKTQKKFDCLICLEKIENKNMKKLICGHQFCSDCIFIYLQTKIINSDINNFICPEDKCNIQIPYEDIIMLIKKDKSLCQKLKKFKKNLEISNNQNLRWCIRPNCEEILEKKDFNSFMKCKCGEEFCFDCGNQWHPGLECEQVINKILQNYINQTNNRNCPHCRQLIEKIDGCNVMQCQKCKFTFCWICLKEYKIGHFSIFNYKGCPGLDSTDPRKLTSRSKRFYECFKGIMWFLIKAIFVLIIMILIYPFLMFIIIFSLIYDNCKKQKINSGRSCDWRRKNIINIFCLIILGILLGILAYVLAPIAIIVLFIYMLVMNPHVALNNAR